MLDFSQLACIPNNEFPSIMDNKHAQMDDRTRMKLKIKLGVFFAKPTDEEISANIHSNPWAEETPVQQAAMAPTNVATEIVQDSPAN